MCFGLLRRIYDSPRNDELPLNSGDSSAEVFLGDFVGFRERDYEIRLIVYRIVERDESRKSVKKTIAPYFRATNPRVNPA